MVEGRGEKIKPGMDRLAERSSFVGPRKERYVTTDCLHTPPLGGEVHIYTQTKVTNISEQDTLQSYAFMYNAIYVYTINF